MENTHCLSTPYTNWHYNLQPALGFTCIGPYEEQQADVSDVATPCHILHSASLSLHLTCMLAQYGTT